MLDPFGSEAKRIIKDEFGGVYELLLLIPSYVGIDQAVERVSWIKSGEIPKQVLEMRNIQDLLTFYALLGALAFSPYGIEMELVKESSIRIYSKRLNEAGVIKETSLDLKDVNPNEVPVRDRTILEKIHHQELPPEEKRKFQLRYKIHLKRLLELWDGSLKDIYIRRGHAYLTWEQSLSLWKRAFEKNFERAVNLLYEIRDELPDYYLRLYERLGEIAREHFKERLARIGSSEAQPLRFELFPPCVKEALKGVPAGLRNYAITVLLTSFLSYARLCPNPPRRDVRIRDCVGDLSVVEKEILPVIIEAGNRCSPPLFEDQPHEIKNIWYHLGFGLTDKPTLEDSGNSTWYFPPNCSKIQANAPQLCKPDRHCRNIKNPLTYYLRRLYLENRGKAGEKESVKGGEEND